MVNATMIVYVVGVLVLRHDSGGFRSGCRAGREL